MVIDRSNYTRTRPRAGDLVLGRGDRPLAVVVRLRSRGRLRVRSLEHGHEYDVIRGAHWEDWLERFGGRLLRRGGAS